LDQRRRHVREHRTAVGAGAVELAAGLLVAHDWDSLVSERLELLGIAVAIPALEHWTALVRSGPFRGPGGRGLWPVGGRTKANIKIWCVSRDCAAFAPPALRRSLRAFVRAGDAGWHRLGAPTHPIIPCEATPAGGQFSSFMPSDRPRWASTSLISVSDFLPRL